MKHERPVTQAAFDSLLSWLDPDRELAAAKYEQIRRRLIRLFTCRGSHDAEDLADETINRVILKVGEENIENRLAYFYGVAKNVYRESLRKERPTVDIDEVSLAAQPPPPEPDCSAECLERCLAELPPESRDLILEYFSEVKLAKIELHKRISESFRVTQTALRMRVMRIKQKLTVCVRECMG